MSFFHFRMCSYEIKKVFASLCVRIFSNGHTLFFETYIRLFTIYVVNTIELKKGETAIVQVVSSH